MTTEEVKKRAELYSALAEGKTIENVIVQLKARLKEIGNSAAKQ